MLCRNIGIIQHGELVEKYLHEKSAFKAEIGDVYSGFSAKKPAT